MRILKYSLLTATAFGFLNSVNAQDSDPTIQERIDRLEMELQNLRQETGKTAAQAKALKGTPSKEAPQKTDATPAPTQKIDAAPMPAPKKSKPEPVDEAAGGEVNHELVDPNPAAVTPAARSEGETDKDFSRAQELYDQAQVYISQKRIQQAQPILEEIIQAYSDAPQYVPARYWLGEIYYARQDYLNASLSFGDIYMRHKSGAKLDPVKDHVAESLIKLAYCLKMMKKKSQACVTLTQVDKDFKKLPRNITLLAQDIKDDLKCSKK